MIKCDLLRHEDAVREMESRPVCTDSILLYGSSFFTNWGYERAGQALSGLPGGIAAAVNHGFGGAVIDELLYYYGRLVKPYSPKIMLLRAGVNDFSAGYSAYEATVLLARLCEWFMADFPGARLGLIPIFDMPMLDWQTDEYREQKDNYNCFCEQYAAQYDSIFLLDINDFFYDISGDMGTPCRFKPIFLEDGLHLKDEGYEQFAVYIRKRLAGIINDI